MELLQIMVLGYLLGMIPFGVVWAKLFRLPDPRYLGSGNIGATNMLRTGRKDVAVLTLLCDMGKGALAVWVANRLFHPTMTFLAMAAALAVIGHMYSVWLRFKGGKGVATMLGAVLTLSWPVGMSVMAIWALLCFTTRYVSLASIAALLTIPLVAWLRIDAFTAAILGIACLIAIWRHRENIRRLRQGFEPRLKFGRGDPA